MNAKGELHPILESLDPSPEQREAVLARDQDIVVTAGAGTGKTRTLVARYLSLAAEGIPLRSIVAITFTNKAAREMRNRVREQVRLYLEKEPSFQAIATKDDYTGGIACWSEIIQSRINKAGS